MSFTNQQPWAGVAGAPDGIVMVRTANFMTLLNGPPQGVLAGQSGSASVPPDMVWDWYGKALYICTQSSGTPAGTIWTEIEFVGPFVGTNIYTQTISVSNSISDQGSLTVQGPTNLQQNVTVGGTLSVAGNTTISGNETVNGTLSAQNGGVLGGTFTGNPIFNFPLTASQGFRLPNNIYLQAADTTATYRSLIGVDTGNNVGIANVGGGIIGWMNQARSTWLMYSSNAGALTIPGTLGVTGAASSGSLSTGSLSASSASISGAATVGNNLTVNGGLYPNGSIYGIGGLGGFNLYSSGGHPTVQLAGNEYIQWDGSNTNYASTGLHVFGGSGGGNIQTSGTVLGGYVHSTGNLQVDGSGTVNGTLGVSSSASVGGNLNVSAGATVGNLTAGSGGAVGANGWTYTAVDTHAFEFWYYGPSGSVICRIDGGTDVTIGTVSDARFKRDIRPSTFDGLAAIRRVPLFSFQWNDLEGTPGGATPIGFVAQDLVEVFPEAVVDTGQNLSISTNTMLAALCAAVQQLAALVGAEA